RVREALARLTLVVASSAVALYIAETYLELHGAKTKLETVVDLRRRGIEAYPAYTPAFHQKVPPGVTPLSGVRLVPTVLAGDLAPIVYDSDEFGFRNPRGLWGQTPQMAILGDSFVQGYGVPAGSDIGAVIRRTYPRTLNLGMNGTGQLIQLAIAREYLARVRPRRVVLLYFEANDLFDTATEFFDPDLARYYFDDGYTQGLADEAPVIDRGLRDWLDGLLERQHFARDGLSRAPLSARLGQIARLGAITDLLRATARRPATLFRGCTFGAHPSVLRVVVDDDARVVTREEMGTRWLALRDGETRRRERMLVANIFS